MKKVFLFLVMAVFFIACGGGVKVAPLEFETYEKEANVDDPESPPCGLVLKFDIPIGDGDLQNKITDGIREIIKQSEVGTALEQPTDGSLKEIADRFATYFAKGEAEPAFYNLEIIHGFQNSQVITFHVIDGIFMNGGPREYRKVVRLSDGHLMTTEEMSSITEDQVKELAKKFGDDDQKELVELMEENGYWLAPDTLGCKLVFQNGSHFFQYVDIPLNDIAPYLSEEGRKLFEVPADAPTSVLPDSKDNKEVNEGPKAELGRGDLGIFELRGPVKTMKDGQTYSFNEKGQWLTIDGRKLSDIYYQVVRDKNGRLKELNADGYGSVGYTFNTDGLATSINEDGFGRELTYNKEGDVIKEVQTIAPEMGDEEGEEEKTTYTYEIIERDKYGNWTKRKANGKEIEKRTISYFE